MAPEYATQEQFAALAARLTRLEALMDGPSRRPGTRVDPASEGRRDDGTQDGQVHAEDAVAALTDERWSSAGDLLRALGHPARLELLRALMSGASSSTELLTALGAGTTGQLYHHLTDLSAAGWIRATGRGRYEIPPHRRGPLLTIIAATRPPTV